MAGSILGAAVKRSEDPRFIRGEGSYIPNQQVDGALWVVPVRSTVPHGVIVDIDTSMAVDMPGVVAVYKAEDLDLVDMPPGYPKIDPAFKRSLVAKDKVRFAGEVVAAVVAETEAQAVDAASMVFPDIDPLPVVVDPREARKHDAMELFEGTGTNVCWSGDKSPGSPMDAAEVRVTMSYESQRMAAVPLETSNAIAKPDGEGLEFWAGSQNVFAHRRGTAHVLGMNADDIREICPDMGGGFGAKFFPYPVQVLSAAVARKLGRPVRSRENRRDNLVDMSHGRAMYIDIELGATKDGVITALDGHAVADVGAYPMFGAFLPQFTKNMSVGVYAIPHSGFSFESVVTNTTPVNAYRGAGRPEAAHMIELAMDRLARKLNIDPAEIRRRNFIQPEQFPYTTPTGAEYDSGEYEKTLDLVLEHADYAGLRAEQQRRRDSGDPMLLGIGLATYVEVTAGVGPADRAEVDVDADGNATVRAGTNNHGQGHETMYKQLVSALTQIDMERVNVIYNDTGELKSGGGTGGSRSLQIGGSAAFGATTKLVDKAKAIVADRLEAAVEDIVLGEFGFGVAGVPDTTMSWAEVAVAAADAVDEEDGSIGLAAAFDFDQGQASYPFGTHLSVVEVDSETGTVRLLRHIACDDAGTVLNPLLVAGQVHGGFAQGAGQVLFEKVRYDEDGNNLSGNLTSYLLPTAESLPLVERIVSETPSPLNPLGAKGIGEAATIGSAPAIHNAVLDAVAPLGVEHIDMPLSPGRVWEAINAATS